MPWDNEPKNWISITIGFLLMILGLIPILTAIKILNFNIPSFLSGLIINIAMYLIAAGGIYILINAFMEDSTMQIISSVVGIILIIIGFIPMLYKFKVIAFNIPFLSEMFYYVLFTVEGFFLVLASFMMQ